MLLTRPLPHRPGPLTRRRRGYLLLEVMVGGVMIAMIIAPLLSVVGQARVETILSARSSVAQSLAMQGAERAAGLDFTLLTAANLPPTQVITAQQGSYTRTFVLTSGTENLLGVNVPYVKVQCEVTYLYEGTPHGAEVTVVRYETSG